MNFTNLKDNKWDNSILLEKRFERNKMITEIFEQQGYENLKQKGQDNFYEEDKKYWVYLNIVYVLWEHLPVKAVDADNLEYKPFIHYV